MTHAFLSASSAHRWMRCAAAPWREKDLPDTRSPEAAEGTAAHFLMQETLGADGIPDTSPHVGGIINVDVGGHATWDAKSTGHNFKVDLDMAREVQKAIDRIAAAPLGSWLYLEQPIRIACVTGEADAIGTPDVVTVTPTELRVDDLKYGANPNNPTMAAANFQLLIYAAAALENYDVLGEIKSVRMRIIQPRLDHFDEWVMSADQVRASTRAIRARGQRVLMLGETQPLGVQATPGEEQCRFCKAKAMCPELRQASLELLAQDFDIDKGETIISAQDAERVIAQAYGVAPADVRSAEGGRLIVRKPSLIPQLNDAETWICAAEDERLATCLGAVDLVENWCKAVRAEVERRALAGEWTDKRYKVVEGKRGARAWADEEQAEVELRKMRLKTDQMYTYKVKSPTQIEKELAEANPRKWKKLQSLITQTGGKPTVVPASDKRPALQLRAEDMFDVQPDTGEDLV